MIIPDGQVRFYSLPVAKCLFPTRQKEGTGIISKRESWFDKESMTLP